ncbi:Ref family protein [Vibrio fluvialis]|uniref:Ref family recombination enhancement nuclease n=2 Tax=Vibrio fluvialis TaxID=676 RepID=UPI002A05FEA0|nr:Ref family protein [Vibrio fluvialis]
MMLGRKPNKAETIYIERVTVSVGCVACHLTGMENDAPPEYLAFHHNPDKGSRDPLCHFFGVPMCPTHHQGHPQAGKDVPIRHRNYAHFKSLVGSDIDMARFCWSRLPLEAQDQIGELTGIWDFNDLLLKDDEFRNQ